MLRTLSLDVGLWVVFLLGVAACPVVAQTGSGLSSSVAASGSWSLGLGYPGAFSVEGALAVGRSTPESVPGRGAYFSGIELGAGAGVGAGVVRLSWADYFDYDAGQKGWSLDALVLRPWGLSWATGRDEWFVGGGASWRRSYFRLTGAVARSMSGGRTRVVPFVQGHLSLPPW
jgi:hypothetical protein